MSIKATMSKMGQTLHTHTASERTFVRYAPNSGQTRVRSDCPLCAISGLMHRSKQHCYSITASAQANNGGHDL